MDRREFIAGTALSAFHLSFMGLPDFLKEKKLGIVVHSYWARWNSKTESQRFPSFTNAMQLIEHCASIGAGGVQVGVKDWTTDFAKKVRDQREKLGLYLEGSIALPATAENVSSFEKEVLATKEAGAQVLRTVCLNGRRYENFHTNEEFQQFRKNAIASIQLAEPIVRKYKMKLAIENHKDWRTAELVEVMKMINSEWVGVTIDFGNNYALLEESNDVVKNLLPYLVSTHVKDMGVDEYEDGFLLSEVPLGQGIVDLKKIFSQCETQNPKVTFNLEMITRDPLQIPCLTDNYWATFDAIPSKEFAHVLKTIRDKKSKNGLPKISGLAYEEKLTSEENNILQCIDYTRKELGMS
jgi:sugar phosphate isomerase/epimerase